MNTRTVQIKIERVYGKLQIYPANSEARALAAIANTKTLTIDTLGQCPNLGLFVEVVDGKMLLFDAKAKGDKFADYCVGAFC